MALPLLLAPVVYGSMYTPFAGFETYAVPPDQGRISGKNLNCGSIEVEGGHGVISTCCWEEGGEVSPPTTKCQTCVINLNTGETDCNPVEISYERPPPTPFAPPAGEAANPDAGQTPPKGTSPRDDISGPPVGGVADPAATPTPIPTPLTLSPKPTPISPTKPTQTFPGDDLFGPPAGQVADPGTSGDPSPTPTPFFPTPLKTLTPPTPSPKLPLTFPGGDVVAPPGGQVADPGTSGDPSSGGIILKECPPAGCLRNPFKTPTPAPTSTLPTLLKPGENPRDLPTQTFPGDDVFTPPDEAADPGSGQNPDDGGGKGKTFLGDDVFTPPDKAADPGAGQNQDDNNGNKGGGVGRPDIGATGPDVGDIKPNPPSGGDGGSGVVG